MPRPTSQNCSFIADRPSSRDRTIPCRYAARIRKIRAMSSLIADHPSVSPLLTERVQRAKLLDGMVRAVAEKGFAAATVSDAVRLARVSRGTFYELFESKDACLAAAYRLGCEVLEQRVADAVPDAVDWREELRP